MCSSIGQNEKTPTVVQDMAGIRVVRTPRRLAGAKLQSATPVLPRQSGVPVAKAADRRLRPPRSTASPWASSCWSSAAARHRRRRSLGYAARISTRLFLADGPDQTEPGGTAASGRQLEGPRLQVHRLQLPPGGGGTDVEQVRRREIEGDPARTALRQPRRRQRGAVRRRVGGRRVADRHCRGRTSTSSATRPRLPASCRSRR